MANPYYIIETLETPRIGDIKALEAVGPDVLLGYYENMTGALTAYSWLLEGGVASVEQLLDHPKSKVLSILQDLVSKGGASIVHTLQDSTTAAVASKRKQGRVLRHFVTAVIYFVVVLTEHGRPPFLNQELSGSPFKRVFGHFLYGHIFQASLFRKNNEIEDIVGRSNQKSPKPDSNLALRQLAALKDNHYEVSLGICLRVLGSVLFATGGTLTEMLSKRGKLVFRVTMTIFAANNWSCFDRYLNEWG